MVFSAKRARQVAELDLDEIDLDELLSSPASSELAPPSVKRRAQAVAGDSESEAELPPAVSSSPPEDESSLVPAAGTPPEVAQVAAAATRVTGGSPVQSAGRLDSLVGMGFLPGRARSALQAANGNLDMALDICLDNRNPASMPSQRGRPTANTHEQLLIPGLPRVQRDTKPQPEVPVSARAKRAAKRQQNFSGGSSDTADSPGVFGGDSSGSESGADPEDAGATAPRARKSAIIRGKVSESEDGSDVSIASGKQKKKSQKSKTRALREVSAAAQAKMLEALSGPTIEGEEAALRKRSNAVRRSITRGHTKLRTDYWPDSEDLVARCESFGKLKVHQRVGVRWMLALHDVVPGMILADEMGLGKTAQALCFLELLNSKRPSLVVAPASVLRTWEMEAARWTPRLCTLKVHAPSYQGRLEAQDAFLQDPEAYQIVITTPQAFNSKENRNFFFRRVNFEYLIVDEAHGLKNSGTLRYKDISKAVKCEHRLLLTGTPVQNCLAELATLMAFALSDGKRNLVSEELRAISEEPMEKALQQMQTAAAPLILRRLKSDVLSELPEKRGLVVYCDLTAPQRAIYDRDMAGAKKEGSTQKGLAKVKDVFLRLRRVCLHPLLCKQRLSNEQHERLYEELREKRPDFQKASRQRCLQEMLAWNDFDKHTAALQHGLSQEFLATESELLDTGKVIEMLRILRKQAETGDKTLVFSQFTQLLDIMEVVFRVSEIPFVRLDGKTAIEDRAGLVASFQEEGGPKVFLLSTKAGGLGLNLTAANAVIMLDLSFNPQDNRQAEDRVHRLGQKQEVTIYYLVGRGTVEEMVLNRNIEKMKLDQNFGAKRSALEVALGADEVDGEEKDEDEDVAVDDGTAAKESEKSVMQQLRAQLKAA